MFTSRKPKKNDAWEGVVEDTSRGMLDGANMYHFVQVRCADGQTRKVRVDRRLWKSLAVGDRIVKVPGSDAAKG
ncbi:hypothetical protein G3I40_00160 [Streptomyces sp. SID14478]|uniref:DUF7489 domain-containing protein n=1 Tax=Streptomyces sp. SID14478 TaxID=2706073 RepID=UPI0013D9CFE0|nr:hypothetical protein [Streptomyces sp. SID14478]NEB73666.1 hypothetical protein [Streptomyces sp. SID14478]